MLLSESWLGTSAVKCRLSIKLLAPFVVSLALEEKSKKDPPPKKMSQDKGLDMNSVQAGAPEEPAMKVNHQGLAKEVDTNGKKEEGYLRGPQIWGAGGWVKSRKESCC